jgi:hypothetical protein
MTPQEKNDVAFDILVGGWVRICRLQEERLGRRVIDECRTLIAAA